MENIFESHIERLTGKAYDRYCEKVGGKAFNGDPLPAWAEFGSDPTKQKQADAWRAATREIVEGTSALVFDPRFYAILERIWNEVAAQDKKWGADRHLHPYHWNTILSEEVGEVARASFEVGSVTGPEAHENFEHYMDECAQVAAVAMQMMLSALFFLSPNND